MLFFSLWQPYITDVGQDRLHDGMERSGLPEGIPSLPEYLAEYCSVAVSAATIIYIYIFNFQFGFFISTMRYECDRSKKIMCCDIVMEFGFKLKSKLPIIQK